MKLNDMDAWIWEIYEQTGKKAKDAIHFYSTVLWRHRNRKAYLKNV